MLDRLRRRDPAAALKKYSGRWRKTGTPAPVRPRPRLRPPLAALPVLRQDGDDGTPGQRAEKELDLDDLDLDDLDLDLDDLDLPDDLKLEGDRPGQADGDADGTDGKDVLTPRSARRARRPRDLKGIRDILPFGDYDPDPDPEDPCRNLCPRPPGCPPVDAGAPGDESSEEGGAGGTDDRSRDTAAYCPEITPLSDEPYLPRPMTPIQYRWAASNIAYNPLYFQDVNLERYGHNYGPLQPLASAGKFGVQLIGLPYQMALDHPHKCVSPLGYYRPGDCAPKLHYQIPLNLRAAVVQAAVVSGIAIVIP